jgi:predicted glycoside hydrolase/deacetylase ChbG (UPF0249 family)
LATASGLDVGLHINFSEAFSGSYVPRSLRRNHDRLRRFFATSKYALVIYNPLLRKAFREVFTAQVGEFARLYGRVPSRFDGHQHLHLCSNMLLDGLLPAGTRVRRNFSFAAGEKSFWNRCYRNIVDRRLARRHRLRDFFFTLSQRSSIAQLKRVAALATSCDVELQAHPHVNVEFEILLSDEFAAIISAAHREVFTSLRPSLRPGRSLARPISDF